MGFAVAPYRLARRSRLRASALVTVLAFGVASCSGASSSEQSDGKAPGYPRSLKNCGERVTVEEPPQRAVSLNQGTTEILLALGLGDRMVGTATWTDPVMKGLGKENRKVERLADDNPSFERVLDKEPDLAVASFESTLGKGGVATRKDFHDLGVPTYLSPTDCTKNNEGDGDGAREKPLALSDVYGEVTDLARMFGEEKRGEKVVGDLEQRVKKATDGVSAADTTLLYWFANAESPYLGGCCGAPGIITEAVGAKNVFDTTHAEWPQVGWERVADKDPDVIVLGDLTRKSQTAETAKAKIEKLESDPVTRELTAVKKKRYIVLTGAAMNPSIRTVEGIEQVADGLRSFGLAE